MSVEARRLRAWVVLGAASVLLVNAPPVVGQAKPPAKPATPAPAPPASAKELLVTTPGDGPYYARLLPGADAKQKDAEPQGPFSSRTITVKYDPAVLGKAPRVAIDDTKSGNSAIVPIPADKPSLELNRLEFDHIRRVEVKVTYDNKPLQTARVTLAPPTGAAPSVIIDPSAQGVAVFNDVPTGKAKLTIKYGENLTEVSDVLLSSEHPAGPLQVPAPVKSQAPTLAVAAPPAAAPGTQPAAPGAQTPPAPSGTQPIAPPQQPQNTGGFTGLLGGLLGLTIPIAALYFLYRWYQSGGMAATLKKAGIEVAGPNAAADGGSPAPWQPNAPPPPVVTDPALCQYCGQRKDAAGNCACTLAPGQSAAPAAPVAAPTQPRLIASMGTYSGSIFPLTGSGATVGRDLAADIPLSNDTTVSRKHASLQPGDGGWTVTDLGSSNGVFVNGVRISGSQPLRSGDEVQIGNTRFRFEV